MKKLAITLVVAVLVVAGGFIGFSWYTSNQAKMAVESFLNDTPGIEQGSYGDIEASVFSSSFSVKDLKFKYKKEKTVDVVLKKATLETTSMELINILASGAIEPGQTFKLNGFLKLEKGTISEDKQESVSFDVLTLQNVELDPAKWKELTSWNEFLDLVKTVKLQNFDVKNILLKTPEKDRISLADLKAKDLNQGQWLELSLNGFEVNSENSKEKSDPVVRFNLVKIKELDLLAWDKVINVQDALASTKEAKALSLADSIVFEGFSVEDPSEPFSFTLGKILLSQPKFKPVPEPKDWEDETLLAKYLAEAALGLSLAELSIENVDFEVTIEQEKAQFELGKFVLKGYEKGILQGITFKDFLINSPYAKLSLASLRQKKSDMRFSLNYVFNNGDLTGYKDDPVDTHEGGKLEGFLLDLFYADLKVELKEFTYQGLKKTGPEKYMASWQMPELTIEPVMTANPTEPEVALNVREFFKELGYKKLTMSSMGIADLDFTTGLYNLKKSEFVIKDGCKFIFDLKLMIPDARKVKMPLDSVTEDYMQWLSYYKLGALGLKYEDLSLIDRILKMASKNLEMEPEMIKTMGVMQVKNFEKQFKAYPKVTANLDSLTDFIANPKKLMITLSPSKPVGVADLEGHNLDFLPDMVEFFNVVVTASK